MPFSTLLLADKFLLSKKLAQILNKARRLRINRLNLYHFVKGALVHLWVWA